MSEREEWQSVPGYEGLYEASSLGRIRCIPEGGGIRTFPAFRIIQGSARNGYFRFKSLRPEDHGKSLNVHVLVATTFHGPRPPGSVVRHLNGNRSDNRASNLAWGSPKENAEDMLRHGTHAQLRKTDCPQGHPYSKENLYLTPSGTRMCRTCMRARDQSRRAKNRDKGLTPDSPKHGTESGYKHHACRCEPCRHAAAEAYQRRKRRGEPSS